MAIENTLKEMLDPYIPECRYLVEAELDFPEARGKFRIPRPFYCVQTGHFNATELFICYNQLSYTMFAEWFDQGLIEATGVIPLEEFKKIQAGDCYLAKVDKLRFGNPIDPTDFRGKIRSKKNKRFNNVAYLPTEFEFSDSNGGKATGEALIAVALNR